MMAKHLELLAAAIDRSRVILSYAQKDERASIEASMFFFEKKNQQTFDPWRRTDGMKFFLLLFVNKKKSSLPSPHLTHPGPARAALMRRHG